MIKDEHRVGITTDEYEIKYVNRFSGFDYRAHLISQVMEICISEVLDFGDSLPENIGIDWKDDNLALEFLIEEQYLPKLTAAITKRVEDQVATMYDFEDYDDDELEDYFE